MFDGLITELDPPPKRLALCEGGRERHMTEAAVMLAFAMHLLGTHPSLRRVTICPDGEHGKRFGIRQWLETQGFRLVKPSGRTMYGGVYEREDQTVIVDPRSGRGDVVAELDGQITVAECKGGIINTRHAGQKSKLERGLCETVGRLIGHPMDRRQIAVVPYTDVTLRLAKKICGRAASAGIEIALVDAKGNVVDIDPLPPDATMGPNRTA